jgi:AAA+ superfamily predicted ATPase
MESLWAGETGKNVTAVFRAASEQDAVLFFDEADAIAGRRFASVTQGYQREANTVVNVLLKELEEFSGVVIFATNSRLIRPGVRAAHPHPHLVRDAGRSNARTHMEGAVARAQNPTGR